MLKVFRDVNARETLETLCQIESERGEMVNLRAFGKSLLE
jgi:hypothetical protein